MPPQTPKPINNQTPDIINNFLALAGLDFIRTNPRISRINGVIQKKIKNTYSAIIKIVSPIDISIKINYYN